MLQAKILSQQLTMQSFSHVTVQQLLEETTYFTNPFIIFIFTKALMAGIIIHYQFFLAADIGIDRIDLFPGNPRVL
jgi:hypothetical protein